MRAIVQRVSAGSVRVEAREVGRCGYGLVLLVGIHVTDTQKEVVKMAEKVANLRIFNDETGAMNRSILDFPDGDRLAFDVLAISNFTVYGDVRKSRRPSFMGSASSEAAKPLFEAFVVAMRSHGIDVQSGIFGAHMEVSLINDGPVTLVVDVDAPVVQA